MWYRIGSFLSTYKYWIVGALFIASSGLGIIGGLSTESPSPCAWKPESVWPCSKAVFSHAYQTAQMFILEGNAPAPTDEISALLIAKYLAPLTLTMSLVIAIFAMIRTEVTWLRMRFFWRKHIIVCGATDNAMAFARSEATSNQRRNIVVIAEDIGEVQRDMAARYGFGILAADPMDPDVLKRAKIDKASFLVAALGDDEENLEVAMRARALVVDNSANVPDETDRTKILYAYVLVRDRQLWRQLSRSDAIDRTEGRFELVPFNLATWAARRFTWSEPLWMFAELRDQDRVHVVFIGFDEYAEALMGQFPACFAYPGHKRPLFTVLAEDAEATKQRINRAFPQIHDFADISVRAFSVSTMALDDDLMRSIHTRAGVTAVIVCVDGAEQALNTAIATQDSMRVTGRWNAPVYVQLTKCEGISDLLMNVENARQFRDVIEPFGVEDTLCSLHGINGGVEETARLFHEDYQRTRQEHRQPDDTTRSQEPLKGWEQLRETYRAANRRAVDHAKTKLAAAGYYVPKSEHVYVADIRLLDGNEEILRLAELEHQSWVIGRAVDGWRAGTPRDDARKIHPDMVPYAALPESTKVFDRQQVRFMRDHFSDEKRIEDSFQRNKATARPEHRIGLIGNNRLSPGEAEVACKTLIDDVLPNICARHQGCHFRFMTPLAPGADYVLAQAAAEFMKQKSFPFSMLIVEAVPPALMIGDYADTYFAGGTWSGSVDVMAPAGASADDWRSEERKLSTAREEFIKSDFVEWVLDFIEPDVNYGDAEARQAGYRRAASYIDRRVHMMVAAYRPLADGESARPGGTEETIRNRRARALSNQHAGIETRVIDLRPA